jgi:hypothetical protein
MKNGGEAKAAYQVADGFFILPMTENTNLMQREVRSPAGISMLNGELFYTDNQGDWMGTGAIFQVKKGSFMGHPAGLKWAGLPNSPVKLTEKQFFAERDNRQTKDAQGRRHQAGKYAQRRAHSFCIN